MDLQICMLVIDEFLCSHRVASAYGRFFGEIHSVLGKFAMRGHIWRHFLRKICQLKLYIMDLQICMQVIDEFLCSHRVASAYGRFSGEIHSVLGKFAMRGHIWLSLI